MCGILSNLRYGSPGACCQCADYSVRHLATGAYGRPPRMVPIKRTRAYMRLTLVTPSRIRRGGDDASSVLPARRGKLKQRWQSVCGVSPRASGLDRRRSPWRWMLRNKFVV